MVTVEKAEFCFGVFAFKDMNDWDNFSQIILDRKCYLTVSNFP